MKTRTQQIKWTCVGAALLIFGGPVKAQSFTEVVQNALAIYPSMLSARAKTEAQRSDIDRARAAHMPQINYGYTRSKYANSDLPASLHSNMRSPSVRFNLWSGGRIEADAERAEALSYSSEYQEAITRDDVALLAAEAYINWARAIDMFELAAKNFESHRITLSDIQKIVDVDTGRRIDLEQAQVRMDNASLTKLQRQTELQQARQRLGRFWQGPLPVKPMGLNEALVPTGRLGQVPQTLELVMDAVSDDLPTIAQQKAQVQAAEAGVTLARGQYWPTVDLTATRQLNPVSNGLFATTYKEDTFTQVQVNMPLYSGSTKRVRRSALVGARKSRCGLPRLGQRTRPCHARRKPSARGRQSGRGLPLAVSFGAPSIARLIEYSGRGIQLSKRCHHGHLRRKNHPRPSVGCDGRFGKKVLSDEKS